MSMKFVGSNRPIYKRTTGMFSDRSVIERQRYKKGEYGISTAMVKEVTKNLEITGEYLTLNAINVVGAIVVDLLQSALPRTPYDTGELRESGRAFLIYDGGAKQDIGYGSREGTVKTTYNRIKRKDVQHSVSGGVSFQRTGEEGTDVAVWTHEDLLPYDKRPLKPAARMPGTGPKYLEGPWYENRSVYVDWIQDAFSHQTITKDLKSAIKVKSSQAKDKYEADIVTVDRAKLEQASRRQLSKVRGKK